MKRLIHIIAAVTAFLVWVALILTMIVNQAFWLDALPYILVASGITMVGTVVLSRYWLRRKSVPSYGSIFLFPSLVAGLLCIGALFLGACVDGNLDVFTLSYWEQAKGGFAELLIPFAIFWFVCLFPAAGIVIYFQKPTGES